MRRRFKTRKRRKKHTKLILFCLFIYIIFAIFNIILKKINKKALYQKEIYLINFNLNKIKKPNISFLDAKSIFFVSLNHIFNNESIIKVVKDNHNVVNPIIYIYNTHQEEEYNKSFYETYNITYTTIVASYILSDYLNDYNISNIVENRSIKEYLTSNNLKYKDSYLASKSFIKDNLNKYPSIKYIIDIHRDSAKKDITTGYYNDKSYAKISFVVGLDNKDYQSNLDFANKLNDKLPKEISRGIIKKSGHLVNGVYNQDLCTKAILIEVGGVDNNIEEVNNTLELFSNILYKEIINEEQV